MEQTTIKGYVPWQTPARMTSGCRAIRESGWRSAWCAGDEGQQVGRRARLLARHDRSRRGFEYPAGYATGGGTSDSRLPPHKSIKGATRMHWSPERAPVHVVTRSMRTAPDSHRIHG